MLLIVCDHQLPLRLVCLGSLYGLAPTTWPCPSHHHQALLKPTPPGTAADITTSLWCSHHHQALLQPFPPDTAEAITTRACCSHHHKVQQQTSPLACSHHHQALVKPSAFDTATAITTRYCWHCHLALLFLPRSSTLVPVATSFS